MKIKTEITQNHPHFSKTGISLVELVIVVAVVSIITALAVPIYKTHILKSRVSEMIYAGASAQLAVTDYFHKNATIDAGASYANATTDFTNTPNPNVIQAIDVTSGVIKITGNPNGLSGLQINLAFIPTTNGNDITWSCNIANGFNIYAPANCQTICTPGTC